LQEHFTYRYQTLAFVEAQTVEGAFLYIVCLWLKLILEAY